MKKVQITAVVFNTKKLADAVGEWMNANTYTISESRNTVSISNRGIVFEKSEDCISIEFDGGYKSQNGFTYTFKTIGENSIMTFKGLEKDYGYGDIRQMLSTCEVSSQVEMVELNMVEKPWPKA